MINFLLSKGLTLVAFGLIPLALIIASSISLIAFLLGLFLLNKEFRYITLLIDLHLRLYLKLPLTSDIFIKTRKVYYYSGLVPCLFILPYSKPYIKPFTKKS